MRGPALDPARTAVVVFGTPGPCRRGTEAARAEPPVQRLLAGARAAGVPVYSARAADRTNRRTDDHADRADVARTDTDQQLRRAEDHDLPRHRWSAFCGTQLELALRSRGIDTVVLVGGSTHVGIASTAHAARDLDLQVVVVRDGCHGLAEQREFFLDKAFPRGCRVRTVDEVLAAIPDAGT